MATLMGRWENATCRYHNRCIPCSLSLSLSLYIYMYMCVYIHIYIFTPLKRNGRT